MKVRLSAALACLALLSSLLPSLAQRVGNTTLRMPLDPPSRVYFAEDAFPGLTFDKPVAITTAPGDGQSLYIIERPGRIYRIADLSNPQPQLFLDISHRVDSDYTGFGAEGLTSIAFHPNYRENRQIFVTYSGLNQLSGSVERFNRLSRFLISPTNPDIALADSEAILFTQIDEGYGHNVNEAVFGPDGYLYVTVGDEGDGRGRGDEFGNTQRIDKDFFAGILRLDVDLRPDNLLPHPHAGNPQNYRIPRDNPWVGATSFQGRPIDPSRVRTEFWAIGFRNPWKMAFDPATGNLMTADVGLHSREEVNLVVKGGNYGWAYFQGTLPGPLTPPAGVQLIPPLHEYPYDWVNGQCVIGGVFYRGTRMPELHGAYIFADHVLGNLWALWLDGQKLARVTKLNSTPYNSISGFGIDPRNGDILIADHARGRILRLQPGQPNSGNDLPAKLSQTGIFADVSNLTPNPGILPYEINLPFWSDNALKRRWFSVPNASEKITYYPDRPWEFPKQTVWVKHFDLEMTKGNPSTARRIETRVLVQGGQGIYGVTYRWNGNDAELVGPDGFTETFTIRDGNSTRAQVWKYPSRGECLSCHTAVGGGPLAFNAAQLNKELQTTSGNINQMAHLNSLGYFVPDISAIQHALPALAPSTDTAQSLEYRARSYLAVNCAQCHQPGGPARGLWDARISTPLSKSGIVNGALLTQGNHSDSRVIVPGNPDRSMILQRMTSTGSDHMPPLGTTVLDAEGINLIRAWITDALPEYRTFQQWQVQAFGSATPADAAADADPDRDGANNHLEFTLGTDPKNPGDAWKAKVAGQGSNARLEIFQPANRSIEVQSIGSLAGGRWSFLNVPENKPTYPAQAQTRSIPIHPDGGSRYYRVKVSEP